ncbi:response regulator transcription factor [Aestuariicoccus sp. MJ-SS9]|uniref:response regulator transcription factor n=1 Tax=Aestuariicoccus sp. MJ-SS9 TaxID=3079855 RepID=UPI002911BE4B|nr:response regulator transcription factor [Aestuariicoccus sp. MJ-SS9]MDU8911992.1 response regulator transcription factor [Aestuariicoccus sp. MJ-SS9]
MSAGRILVVDDEEPVRKLIRNCFEDDGYDVDEAESMASAHTALAERAYDLITLDTVMGSENGAQHLQSIKNQHGVLVILVTGKNEVIDRVVGLELGADDYVTKPFHVRELLARTHALLRRKAGNNESDASPPHDHLFRFDGWLLDMNARELTEPDGKQVALTTADYSLLLVFLKNPRRVLSRDQLMDLIGGLNWTPLDRTIDNQVARLRKKIERDPQKPEWIKSVRGVGYSFTSNVSTEA